MNYKHLSKWHYIYRLTFGGDWKAHVEKLPIAYSNKHYIYVAVPGDDELHKIVLTPAMYESRDAYEEVSAQIEENIVKSLASSYANRSAYYRTNNTRYFLLDDPAPLHEMAERLSALDLQKEYLFSLKRKCERDVADAKTKLEQETVRLAAINARLDQIGKTNEQTV